MTNLIAKVAELRKLEAKATGDQWDSIGESISTSEMADVDGEGDRFIDIPYDENDAEFIAALRNAAPKLLAALGKVHATDSEILDLFVAFMERFKPDGHLNDVGPGAKITNAKAAACLRRYADLARLMESSP